MERAAYINGKIYTVNEGFERAEACLVEDGRFAAVGTTEEISRLAKEGGGSWVLRDLKGKTVLPGFNDSHIHLLNYAYSLTKFELNRLTSIEEIITAGKKYIEKKAISAGEWVLGRGWNQEFLKENRPPEREDLDRISKVHPICLTRVCEHMVVVNTQALRAAGIDESTPDPEGGEIERDENGRLTGMLKETARYLIYRIIPSKSQKEIKDMLEHAIKTVSGYGITSVQTDDFETFSDKDWRKVIRAYEELNAEGRLKVRVYEQCLLPQIDRLKEFLGEGCKTGQGNEKWRIGPLKLLTDGSLGGRTAFLSRHYEDDPQQRGIPVFTEKELEELIVTAHTHGMQVLCHGIGDAAMNMILDCYLIAQSAAKQTDARMGILHVQITDEALIRRFKEQSVLAYLEPVCLNSDLHIAEKRVGKELCSTSYQYRTFYDLGISTPMSSDCPVDSLNPFDSMYVGVNRKDYSGFPKNGWMPQQRLTVEQMLKGFTILGAYASFEETIKGSIEAGKLADFIIVSEDPLEIETDKLNQIVVEETYLSGVCVFKRESNCSVSEQLPFCAV